MEIKRTSKTATFKPNPEILARFAYAFLDNTSMKKTKLHLVSKVRWNSFVRYMDWLMSNDYVACRIEAERGTYVLTDKGREMFERLLAFLACVRPKGMVIIT
jgi:predicted transcriptional regulator